ncbi:MAG: S-ribosylhomocysteine lyase [Clostridiales bacterium]|nr:S-ribosylhomocysteine lyase [Clostridiales bacterium]
MKRIASFQIDHDLLQPGMYLSRVDGGVVTYDLRFVRPNTPPFLTNGSLHTIEHLFATYVRNSDCAENVVYFGPMGCRTGFYFLTQGLSHERAIALTKGALRFIAAYTGDIPGTTAKECGNYREHDLEQARKDAQGMAEALEDWGENQLSYPGTGEGD